MPCNLIFGSSPQNGTFFKKANINFFCFVIPSNFPDAFHSKSPHKNNQEHMKNSESDDFSYFPINCAQ